MTIRRPFIVDNRHRPHIQVGPAHCRCNNFNLTFFIDVDGSYCNICNKTMEAGRGGAVDAVQAFVQGAVSFSETWDLILEKLKALQSIGNHLSEVIFTLRFFKYRV